MDAKTEDKSAGKCPVMHTPASRSNRDWWPNQLNLQVLHQNSALSNPMDRAGGAQQRGQTQSGLARQRATGRAQ